MDARSHPFPGYPAEMLDLHWELDGEGDDSPVKTIRLRGSLALKNEMERIALLQTKALKDFMRRRKGMSANRLWLSIANNFRLAFLAKFGPLPPEGDELAERQYAERVAEAMKQHAAQQPRRRK